MKTEGLQMPHTSFFMSAINKIVYSVYMLLIATHPQQQTSS